MYCKLLESSNLLREGHRHFGGRGQSECVSGNLISITGENAPHCDEMTRMQCKVFWEWSEISLSG